MVAGSGGVDVTAGAVRSVLPDPAVPFESAHPTISTKTAQTDIGPVNRTDGRRRFIISSRFRFMDQSEVSTGSQLAAASAATCSRSEIADGSSSRKPHRQGTDRHPCQGTGVKIAVIALPATWAEGTKKPKNSGGAWHASEYVIV